MWLVRIFRRLLGTLLLHKPHVHICCQQDKSVTGLPEGLPGSGCALPFIELELPCPADFLHSDAGGWKYLVALYIKNNFNRWNRKGCNTVACWLMCVFPALSFFFITVCVSSTRSWLTKVYHQGNWKFWQTAWEVLGFHTCPGERWVLLLWSVIH